MRIDGRLRESAVLHGARPALVEARGRHSFAELDVKSERLAAALQTGGVVPGDRVVVFMDNGWEALVSVLSVFKAGGVLVPIGAEASATVLAEVLNVSRPVAIVTQSRLAGAVATAIASLRSVGLVVLAGGDRSRTGDTCISFEEVVGRFGRVPPLAAAGADTDPAVVIGNAAPLTHRELLDAAAATAIPDDGMALPPFAEPAGLARLLAAIGAGRTMIGRAPFPRENEAARGATDSPPVEARFDLSVLLQSVAGSASALHR